MKITEYAIGSHKIKGNISAALVTDLHGRCSREVLRVLRSMTPDVILLAGDILEVSNEYMQKRNENSFEFLKEAVKIAPIYYCFGNHELYYSHAAKMENRVSNPIMLKENIEKIKALGVNLINDSYAEIDGSMLVGGVVCGYDKLPSDKNTDLDLEFIDNFSKNTGFKILLCHYPHYYEKYLKDIDVDLIVSGHAHGGQWRIFNRGVYAPHQGLFPKYTAGIHDGKLIISTGAVNNSRPIPRFFNPTEIVKINIFEKEEML